MSQALLSLAALLCPSDPAIVHSVASALKAPSAYVAAHEETAVRFPASLGAEDERVLPWIALVDELKERNVAVELDWKTDREDVLWNLKQLVNYGQLSPHVRDSVESLSLQDHLTIAWLRAVATVSEADHIVVATMDIDSDSYVVLLLRKEDYVKAAAYAGQAGHRIEDIRTHDPNAFSD